MSNKFFGGIAAAVALMLTACASGVSTAPSPSPTSASSEAPPLRTQADVVFEVTGTATSASLTFGVGTEISQNANAAVPLTSKGQRGIRISVPYGTFVALSAQNNGDAGTITCTITSDGEIVSTTTSKGGYVIASCSGKA